MDLRGKNIENRQTGKSNESKRDETQHNERPN